jgi:hypothetical protein
MTSSGWALTHQRWAALREIEDNLARAVTAGFPPRLPWSAELAELFGERAALVAMLRYHWQLAREAQLDPDLTEGVYDEQQRAVAARFAGVRHLLAHLEDSDAAA